ncbi:MAG: hypothetical protein ABR564_00860 [Candidatus Dormibacteria bacterium]
MEGVNVGQFLNVTRSGLTSRDKTGSVSSRIASPRARPSPGDDTKDAEWDLSFSRLERYVALYGHAAPPGSEHNEGPHI